MHLQSLIAAVGLVATANALLLPPDLPISDNDAISTLPVPTDVDVDVQISKAPETQTLALKCPGCIRRKPFNNKAKHHKEIPSHLTLDFSIESTDGADRLTVNGYELYPNPDPLRETLTAAVQPDMSNRRMGNPMRVKGKGKDKIKPHPQNIQPLGFGTQVQTVHTDDDDDLQLVSVEIQIIEVGNVFVDGIPNVQVKLVKTPSGKLAIGTIDVTDMSAGNPMDKQKECSTMLCRWKALFFEKLSKLRFMKGCGGNRGQRPPFPHHGQGPHPHHMKPKHRWGQIFMTIASHILLPVLIGILAGVSASIIGMMAGTFAVFIWRMFYRRSGSRSSHRCRYAHKAAKEEIAVDGEKSGLMADQEEVEAPPAYVEAGLAAAEDKKPENEA
ncbi:hypothetical protein F5Y19DRAFT_459648 [Xylariaceae sp. FL1651]|nr:hypothetical protein F5Y19DRAFT_459648 [Xylariaceae sp. FL1651]